MAIDQTSSITDTESARTLLEQSLIRLARGGFKAGLIVVGLIIVAEFVFLWRVGSEVGIGHGVSGGAQGTVIKYVIILIVLRVVLLPVLKQRIYAALFQRGELQEVELGVRNSDVSEGFRSQGRFNYMIHGGVAILESLFGSLLPLRRVGYTLPREHFPDQVAFLYPDEVPVVTPGGKGLALVDPQNVMKCWLVRKAGS